MVSHWILIEQDWWSPSGGSHFCFCFFAFSFSFCFSFWFWSCRWRACWALNCRITWDRTFFLTTRALLWPESTNSKVLFELALKTISSNGGWVWGRGDLESILLVYDTWESNNEHCTPRLCVVIQHPWMHEYNSNWGVCRPYLYTRFSNSRGSQQIDSGQFLFQNDGKDYHLHWTQLKARESYCLEAWAVKWLTWVFLYCSARFRPCSAS